MILGVGGSSPLSHPCPKAPGSAGLSGLLLLDSFGPDRVVFGGDWPVCLLVASYRQWLTALKEVISERKRSEQRKLLHDNAVKIYRLLNPAGR